MDVACTGRQSLVRQYYSKCNATRTSDVDQWRAGEQDHGECMRPQNVIGATSQVLSSLPRVPVHESGVKFVFKKVRTGSISVHDALPWAQCAQPRSALKTERLHKSGCLRPLGSSFTPADYAHRNTRAMDSLPCVPPSPHLPLPGPPVLPSSTKYSLLLFSYS